MLGLRMSQERGHPFSPNVEQRARGMMPPMKKIVSAVLLVAVVVFGVWGYRTIKGAFMAPVELVETKAGPFVCVFGPPISKDKAEQKKQQEALVKAVSATGARTMVSVPMLIRDGGTSVSTGIMVEAHDAAKLRSLPPSDHVIRIAAGKGWTVPPPASAGTIAMAVGISRFMMTAMQRAKTLGLKSYVIVMEVDGSGATPVMVGAPE